MENITSGDLKQVWNRTLRGQNAGDSLSCHTLPGYAMRSPTLQQTRAVCKLPGVSQPHRHPAGTHLPEVLQPLKTVSPAGTWVFQHKNLRGTISIQMLTRQLHGSSVKHSHTPHTLSDSSASEHNLNRPRRRDVHPPCLHSHSAITIAVSDLL